FIRLIPTDICVQILMSLHDALPICRFSVFGRRSVKHHIQNEGEVDFRLFEDITRVGRVTNLRVLQLSPRASDRDRAEGIYWGEKDRKSTRLNSSHVKISYAVFCLKK